jgi:hypothetical protein
MLTEAHFIIVVLEGDHATAADYVITITATNRREHGP